MTDECQYLEYRPLADESGDGGTGDGRADDAGTGEDSGDGGSGDREPRAYCTAADQFVQVMRADICNRRYGLDPETDCEFYRDAEGLPTVSEGEGARAEAASDPRTDGTGGD